MFVVEADYSLLGGSSGFAFGFSFSSASCDGWVPMTIFGTFVLRIHVNRCVIRRTLTGTFTETFCPLELSENQVIVSLGRYVLWEI
jgi:hypothetical protein